MSRSIKVLIVDDEPLARKYIISLLDEHPIFDVIGECGNGVAAGAFIIEHEPDLVFLDIQMPEMDGFSMLRTLDPSKLPAIVFTTAFEDFALRAFEFHALDYLLKPFDKPRFEAAVAHAKNLLTDRQAGAIENGQIAELLRHVAIRPTYLERLLIKKDGRILFLKVRDIDLIKADGKYVQLHVRGKTHLVRQSLRSMRSQLDPSVFIQIHRSVVVNVEEITEIHPLFSNEHEIVLKNGAKVAVSRNYKEDLFAVIGRPL